MINPVAFSVFGLHVTWYALSYIVGFLVALCEIKYLAKKYLQFSMKSAEIDDIFNYAIVGIILGGRIGHVLFFDFDYYSANFTEIFKIWRGGMSFHGGVLGVLVAMFCVKVKYHENFFKILDLISLVSWCGIFCGRIANFVNQELVGIKTNSQFGVVFDKIDLTPRYPTQIYEAIFEGLFVGAILHAIFMFLSRGKKYLHGLITAWFLILYGIFRFFIEFLKEPDTSINSAILDAISLSIGQILCILMIAFGALLLAKIHFSKK